MSDYVLRITSFWVDAFQPCGPLIEAFAITGDRSQRAVSYYAPNGVSRVTETRSGATHYSLPIKLADTKEAYVPISARAQEPKD